MYTHNPSFSFPLVYAGVTVNCNVIMQETAFDIMFDGSWMASIEHTDEWTWIQASGIILPESIIEEIGDRVESEYK